MINYMVHKFIKPAFIVILMTAVGMILFLQIYKDNVDFQGNEIDEAAPPNVIIEGKNKFEAFKFEENSQGKWRKLTEEQKSNLSALGKILYLDAPYPTQTEQKSYKILLWKYGSTIYNRHIKRYSNEIQDPFEFCSVKNCEISYNDTDLESADIVIAHLHRTKGLNDLPPEDNRKPEQIWAFLTDESPYHTFLSSKNNALKNYNGKFNWSIGYRMDTDVPVPYGRTVLRKDVNPEQFNFYEWGLAKKHDVLVSILGSNCGSNNRRWEYVKELKKHIKVDMYGGCGDLKCPGHFKLNCPAISDYMFYLSFENSNCDEYITEKLWWNAYSKNSIPVIMGDTKASLMGLLPPHSFIHVEDYATPRDLATYLTYLIHTPSELQTFFQWKKYFTVLNEHGYFQSVSYHYCRVCEALNYNDRKSKTYNDLEGFWSVKKNCHPSWE